MQITLIKIIKEGTVNFDGVISTMTIKDIGNEYLYPKDKAQILIEQGIAEKIRDSIL